MLVIARIVRLYPCRAHTRIGAIFILMVALNVKRFVRWLFLSSFFFPLHFAFVRNCKRTDNKNSNYTAMYYDVCAVHQSICISFSRTRAQVIANQARDYANRWISKDIKMNSWKQTDGEGGGSGGLRRTNKISECLKWKTADTSMHQPDVQYDILCRKPRAESLELRDFFLGSMTKTFIRETRQSWTTTNKTF